MNEFDAITRKRAVWLLVNRNHWTVSGVAFVMGVSLYEANTWSNRKRCPK